MHSSTNTRRCCRYTTSQCNTQHCNPLQHTVLNVLIHERMLLLRNTSSYCKTPRILQVFSSIWVVIYIWCDWLFLYLYKYIYSYIYIHIYIYIYTIWVVIYNWCDWVFLYTYTYVYVYKYIHIYNTYTRFE